MAIMTDRGNWMKKWMTVPEVAEHFSCSRRYIYTLIETGRLEVINLSGEIGRRGLRVDTASVARLESEKVDYDA